ncbi:MAG: hypothetical protein FVQ81_11115 [Candidatus Glassbacteria bacterium]|nr:hypothetical protein [Candidatus Glassbacteria bacterium]
MQINKTAAAIALTWIAVSLLASILGWTFVWGLMPAEPFVAWWVVPATAVSAFLFLTVLTGRKNSLLKPVLTLKDNQRNLLAFAVILLAIWVGWLLRSKNHFLGDGWAFVGAVQQDFSLSKHEPLDFFSHQVFYRFLTLFGISNGEHAYSILHVSLLAPYIVVLWKTAKLITQREHEFFGVFLLLLSTSTLQLFFGYVESYTLVNLCVAGYLYASLRYISNNKTGLPLIPAATLILAVLFHLSAVVLLPSLIILLIRTSYNGKPGQLYSKQKLTGKSSLVLFGVCVAVFLIAYNLVESEILVPTQTRPDHPFTLLSLENVWYKLNFIIFAAPMCVVALLILPLKGSRKILSEPNDTFVFVFWAALSTWTFALIFDPLLGIRDWDIFTITGLPTTLLAALILIRVLAAPAKAAIIYGIALAAFVHSITFIWTNADDTRGLRYISRVSKVDMHKSSNLITLGFMAAERGYYKTSLVVWSEVKGRREYEALVNKGMVYNKMGFPDSAIAYIEPNLEKASGDLHRKPMIMNLAIAYENAGKLQQATQYYLRFLQLGYKLNQSSSEYWGEQLKNAEFRNRYWLEKDKLNSNGQLLCFYLRYYTILSDTEQLAKCYQQASMGMYMPDEWSDIILIARYSATPYIYNILAEIASIRYPAKADYFRSLIVKK